MLPERWCLVSVRKVKDREMLSYKLTEATGKVNLEGVEGA